MATVKVRYVGNKPLKRDTVTGSLAVWAGENSVVEVPESVAVQLCQYPTVWRVADGTELARPAAKLPDPFEEDGSDDADGDTGDTGETGEAPVVLRPDDEHGFETPPPPSAEVSVDEIVQALPLLDKEVDFTAHGKPMIASVRDRFPGREVTTKAVKAAWEKFTAKE